MAQILFNMSLMKLALVADAESFKEKTRESDPSPRAGQDKKHHPKGGNNYYD